MVSNSQNPYKVIEENQNNPNKQQLIKAFGDLLAKDCFEIVI
jgi:hypothetical protein